MFNESSFRIGKIKINNFKNFQNLEIELNKFNVLVGSNASGKSNFINIFSFLRDILTNGLCNAISYNGGAKYIQNFSSNSSLDMEIHFISDKDYKINKIHPRKDYRNFMTTNKIVYKFSIKFNKTSNYKILKDELTIHALFLDPKLNKKNYGKIIFSKYSTRIVSKYDFPDSAGSILQEQFEFFRFSPLASNQLLLETKTFGYIVPKWSEFLDNIGIYNFEPKSLKSHSSFRSKHKLEFDGSNFSIILNQIQRNKQQKQILMNYLSAYLPFLKTVCIDTISDGRVSFTLKEIYSSSKQLPATFVSDGTANIMAIIVCLFLQNNKLIVIEEPERNIQSSLLSGIVKTMKEVSETNQIFITTHNVELLDQIPDENILLVSKDKKGNSVVIKPKDHETVQEFQDILSMSMLMKQNILR